MSYQVTVGKKAMKELEKIHGSDYRVIKETIYSLADNPRPHGCKKLQGRPAYRIRKGNYRIIYEVFDHDSSVEIVTLGHRKDVYH